ncbi:hypothetical protein EG68_00322 [Paragonimus skrjabini miyazakii]|uniref:Short coiled-coil protein A n=1 Tax=Paragonimus skrjabini miyazakii TaxID=59628 RepID=A0A8S9Z981_9TREM|nr:hypothetical protein EG68_00322 [Paragonimus skrjabini miyazakii]
MDSVQNSMTETIVSVDETDATGSLTTDCDGELNEADQEEKQRLIKQILELQHTLEDLSARVDVVKEENLKLHSENQILGQYIENMMANSSVFQSTSPHSLENRRHVTSGNTRGM